MRLSQSDRRLLDSASALVPIVPRLAIARFALTIVLKNIKEQRGAIHLAALPR